jgi:hypothetical protein
MHAFTPPTGRIRDRVQQVLESESKPEAQPLACDIQPWAHLLPKVVPFCLQLC